MFVSEVVTATVNVMNVLLPAIIQSALFNKTVPQAARNQFSSLEPPFCCLHTGTLTARPSVDTIWDTCYLVAHLYYSYYISSRTSLLSGMPVPLRCTATQAVELPRVTRLRRWHSSHYSQTTASFRVCKHLCSPFAHIVPLVLALLSAPLKVISGAIVCVHSNAYIQCVHIE